jgi:hypothetical protein
LPGDTPLRFDVEAGRGVAFRLDPEMRFWDLETNRDRRVGYMFKAPYACDYWRSQKASSTAGAIGGGSICDLVTTDAADKVGDKQRRSWR